MSIITKGLGALQRLILQGYGKEEEKLKYRIKCSVCGQGCNSAHVVRQWAETQFVCSSCYNKLTQNGRINPYP